MAMNRKAWVSQLKRHVDQYGADNASWYVNWIDPDGKRKTKSCGAGPKGKRSAEALAERTHAELVAGTYDKTRSATWDAFRQRFDRTVVGVLSPRSAEAATTCLDTWERLAKPLKLARITSETIDEFKAKRLAEPKRLGGVRDKVTGELPKRRTKGGTVSVATVNRELRYVRQALRTAAEWGLIDKVPRVRMLREPQRLPTFVPEDHFAAIYRAASQATVPVGVPNVSTTDWWRGLLVFGYMTGWRIGQTLALRWSDVDLDHGTAITRAADNKGKRDMRTPLHPLVVEHLRKLTGSFDDRVFPWDRRTADLWHAFVRIQKVTTLPDGTPLPKGGRSGGWYGFHDLRRAFATMNASGLSLFELQSLMQHADLSTTRRYANMAETLHPAVGKLHVPQISAASG
jgi:integrase